MKENIHCIWNSLEIYKKKIISKIFNFFNSEDAHLSEILDNALNTPRIYISWWKLTKKTVINNILSYGQNKIR